MLWTCSEENGNLKNKKMQSCITWILLKVGLVFVIKTVTFLTVDDSSVSANWSSSSPDMAFSFPLQSPIFCPAKKSAKWDLPISSGKSQLFPDSTEAAIKEFTGKYIWTWGIWQGTQLSGSQLGWSPCPYSAGVMEAIQYPEVAHSS